MMQVGTICVWLPFRLVHFVFGYHLSRYVLWLSSISFMLFLFFREEENEKEKKKETIIYNLIKEWLSLKVILLFTCEIISNNKVKCCPLFN